MGTLAIIILALVAIAGAIMYFVQKKEVENLENLLSKTEKERFNATANFDDTCKTNSNLKTLVNEQDSTITKLRKEIEELNNVISSLKAQPEQDKPTKKASDILGDGTSMPKPSHQQKDDVVDEIKPKPKRRFNNNKK